MTLRPCGSCPYRRDVPSGIWDRTEYEKLPGYDNPTPEQPPAAFMCHQQNGNLCAGWVGCHDMNESLGLRIAAATGSITPDQLDEALDYTSPVPLFESGAAARDHGLRDLTDPGVETRRTVDKLRRRRLRQQRRGRRG